AEERVDGVPGDRAEPVDDPGDDDALAEGQAGRRNLGHAGPGTHGREDANEARTDHVADDDRRHAQPPAEPDDRGQRADEERGRDEVRAEPVREEAVDRTVASGLRY